MPQLDRASEGYSRAQHPGRVQSSMIAASSHLRLIELWRDRRCAPIRRQRRRAAKLASSCWRAGTSQLLPLLLGHGMALTSLHAASSEQQ